MSSQTYTDSTTFTITPAKYLASKVATDLKRIQRLYGLPTDKQIADYEIELTAMVRAGYLRDVTYGYQKNGQWIEPTEHYDAKDLLSGTSVDDDPGSIKARGNIEGATFKSFMNYSSSWSNLSQSEQDAFEKTLPFQRSHAEEPTVNGLLVQDKTYSSGGRALSRSSVRSY